MPINEIDDIFQLNKIVLFYTTDQIANIRVGQISKCNHRNEIGYWPFVMKGGVFNRITTTPTISTSIGTTKQLNN